MSFREIPGNIFISIHFVLFILMVISASTDYWATNGDNHKGLWKQCLREGNLTGRGSRICCSSLPDEAYIEATRAFVIINLIFEGAIIFAYITIEDEQYQVSLWGAYLSVLCYLLIIPLSVYGANIDDTYNVSWSFYILVGSFITRSLTMIFGCAAGCNDKKDGCCSHL